MEQQSCFFCFFSKKTSKVYANVQWIDLYATCFLQRRNFPFFLNTYPLCYKHFKKYNFKDNNSNIGTSYYQCYFCNDKYSEKDSDRLWTLEYDNEEYITPLTISDLSWIYHAVHDDCLRESRRIVSTI